ncbi:serine/threonine-protein kinase [Lentisphaera profundi]|uniref:Serine/threonine-protein kinase n=1 Tax=Lentisphaera profundi TaxID=1658616 RepID=A0ABY7VX63_9BACT|nr:serine/threonine-protein kinase [Lentisphaera profundi]WDE98687.1 serine/threonine-protein kinase [Lentisphaera profundi]
MEDSETIFDEMIPDLAAGIMEMDENIPDVFPLCDEIAENSNRYQNGSTIGQGGMKCISDSVDIITGRHVAMAHLKGHDSPELMESFFKEARLTARLEHPNIVPLYDMGYSEGGEAFFTMKKLGGRNLTELITEFSKEKNYKSLLPRIVDVMIKICDAIAYAHSRGVIHLDIKPDNIRIGDFGEVLICDWGLAKTLGDEDYELDEDLLPENFNTATLNGVLKGSPGYMAPEQVDRKRGQKDQRTDVYALGAILYELLCFHVPNEGSTVLDSLERTLCGDRKSPSCHQKSVPASLEAISLKALALERSDRYQNVQDFRDDLFKWLGGFATSAEELGFLGSLKLFIFRHRLASFFTLILLSLAGIFTYRINQEKQTAVEALELYTKEQKQKEIFGKEASPRLVGLATRALKTNDFETASEMISLAVEADPHHEYAWAIKARIDFIHSDLAEARRSLSLSAGKSQHHGVIDLEVFLLGRDQSKPDSLDLKDFRKLASRPNSKYDVVSAIIANINNFILEEQIELCQLLLQIKNGGRNLTHFSYEIKATELHVDLADNKALKNLTPLKYIPITHLNLSRNHELKGHELEQNPLVMIDLSRTNFSDWKTLFKIPSLKMIRINKGMKNNVPSLPENIKLEIVK